MVLSAEDWQELAAWRRQLHRAPELSGEERETAREVVRFLTPTRPDAVVEGLGGAGVGFVYEGSAPGPTAMARAELDALPIMEVSGLPHRSQNPGKAHACGHDGHMATLAGVARALGRERPRRGRALLLFQPAEETGAGAASVIADPKFAALMPDIAFAYHNMPGLKLGRVALAEGPIACASRGLKARFSGKTAHASTPEFGRSPMRALASLMPALTALSRATPDEPDFALVTIVHARLGEPAFGVAPGAGELWATLRTLTDAGMSALVSQCERGIRAAAAESDLGVEIDYADVFEHCENAPAAVATLRRALDGLGIPFGREGLPMRASEDFGRFGKIAPAAMFLVGAGERNASLHNPDYDFPDELIGVAAAVLARALFEVLG